MEEVWVLNEYGEQTAPAPPGLSTHHWLQGGQEMNPWCKDSLDRGVREASLRR